MAIIRCPECGHQISDRAPVCPSCGIEIAGKVTHCPQCGEVYLKDMPECPYCHHPNHLFKSDQVLESKKTDEVTPIAEPKADSTIIATPPSDNPKKGEKKSHTTLIVALILSLLFCGVGYFFYNYAQQSQEKEAYAFAMSSKDPNVLENYLNKYKNAPAEHIDSIQAHLTTLQQIDNDWTNAVVSNSKAALESYLQKHPDSPYKVDALHKIDSLDFVAVQQANNLVAYQTYLADHPNGEYVDEVNDNIKKINSTVVQPEERLMISSVFRTFFQSINSKDEDGLTSMVSPLLSSFLGKSDATKSDVITFLNKLYNNNVSKMTWTLQNDFNTAKKEIGDEKYEYSVNFSANQNIENIDGTSTTQHYKIKAKIDPDNKISEFNMTRIIQ